MDIEKEIHEFFDISLFLKAVHAAIEVAGGLVLYFATQEHFLGVVGFFVKDEISEEPHNFILNYILHLSQYFASSSKTFLAIYLLSHGLINMFIVYNLYKERLWAYPLSITIFGFFTVYQIYQFIFDHSLILIFLTILDLLVIYLVWHEYKIVKKVS